MTQRPQDIPSELKTCELCGRLFVRVTDPGLRWDKEGKQWVKKAKQRECSVCLTSPLPEEEPAHITRSYRLIGVKI